MLHWTIMCPKHNGLTLKVRAYTLVGGGSGEGGGLEAPLLHSSPEANAGRRGAPRSQPRYSRTVMRNKQERMAAILGYTPGKYKVRKSNKIAKKGG